jgi:ketosteroid isomerase-like protein
MERRLTAAGADLSRTIDDFVAAFNEPHPDLDRVMSFFADDATYLPGRKPELRGLAAIRREFAPQFAGRFGAMRFDVYDKIVDADGRISGKFTYATFRLPLWEAGTAHSG